MPRLVPAALSLLLLTALAPSTVYAQRVRAAQPNAEVTVRVRGDRAPAHGRRGVRRANAAAQGNVDVRMEVSVPTPRVVVVEQSSLGVSARPHEEVREQPPRPPPRESGGGLRVASFQLGYAGGWDQVGELQNGLKLAITAHLADDTWFLEFGGTPLRWGQDMRGRPTNAPSGTLGVRLAVTIAPQYARFYGVLATGGGAMTYPDQQVDAVGAWVSQLGVGVEFGGPGFTDEDSIGGFVDVRAEAWVFGERLEARVGVTWSAGLAIAIY